MNKLSCIYALLATIFIFCLASPSSQACSSCNHGGNKPEYNGSTQIEITVNEPVSLTLSVSGEKPMVFSADNLPPDLSLNLKSGTITGKVTKPGSYSVAVTISNKHGSQKVDLSLIVK